MRSERDTAVVADGERAPQVVADGGEQGAAAAGRPRRAAARRRPRWSAGAVRARSRAGRRRRRGRGGPTGCSSPPAQVDVGVLAERDRRLVVRSSASVGSVAAATISPPWRSSTLVIPNASRSRDDQRLERVRAAEDAAGDRDQHLGFGRRRGPPTRARRAAWSTTIDDQRRDDHEDDERERGAAGRRS